eukprot:augustus_masked-scaffold_83-processed-gene-0.7-mRNA-1 protein AED:1.00 eAED:1.00 QI:0/-1/0/0/-1/1/1/0/127
MQGRNVSQNRVQVVDLANLGSFETVLTAVEKTARTLEAAEPARQDATLAIASEFSPTRQNSLLEYGPSTARAFHYETESVYSHHTEKESNGPCGVKNWSWVEVLIAIFSTALVIEIVLIVNHVVSRG